MPGLVATDMLVESFLPLAKDTRQYYLFTAISSPLLTYRCRIAALSGGLAVYLSHPHADFLSGRFLSVHWDVDEVQARKDEIITKNLLQVEIGGW